MRYTWDLWHVLPNRNVTIAADEYVHAPCGMSLVQFHIEDNWCPFCCATINKAADRRARDARDDA